MSVTIKSLAMVAIGTVAATAYTVPAGTTAVLRELNLNNTANAPRKVRVHRVPTAGTAGTANAIIYDMTIPAHSPFPLQYYMVLEAGDRLQVLADAVGVTLIASGVEEVQ